MKMVATVWISIVLLVDIVFRGRCPLTVALTARSTTEKARTATGRFRDQRYPHQQTPPSNFRKAAIIQRRMVRNIDLVEALIFFGAESILQSGNNESEATVAKKSAVLLPGVDSLIDECHRDDTAVLAILESEDHVKALSRITDGGNTIHHIRRQSASPPNPRDLYESIQAVEIQPKGFGGSSGFGSKAPDPERTPLPKHCVVLCSDEDQCRAARYMGMRVLCMTDNALADAVIDDGGWSSIVMDDIATPGSFWLNPPHPRDDEGNAVDPLVVMERYESQGSKSSLARSDGGDDTITQEGALDDDYLAAILADMDPL